MTTREDGILNALSSLGSASDRHTHNRPSKPFIFSDQLLDDIYEGGRFASVIIDRLPEDCTRAPFEVTSKTDLAPLFQDELERLNVRTKFQRAHKWSRLMGGAGILMMIEDGLPLDEPVNPARVNDVTALHVFDRSELIVREWYRDIQHPEFGEHKLYSLTPSLGTGPIYVHASRILPFKGRGVRRARQDRYDYWGQSEIERIWQSISDLETATGALATSMHNAQFMKLKLKNLKELLTGQDGNPTLSRLLARLEAIRLTQSVINGILIDAENEDIENVSADLKGLIDGYGVFQQNLAFIAEMPLSLLFGNHPKGFSNSDESGVANYLKNIGSTQFKDYQPNLIRLLDMLACAKLGPSKGRRIPDLRVKFAPVKDLEPLQVAEVTSKMVQTALSLIEAEVITPDDERRRLAQSELSTSWLLADEVEDTERQAALEEMRQRRALAREFIVDEPEGAEFLAGGSEAEPDLEKVAEQLSSGGEVESPSMSPLDFKETDRLVKALNQMLHLDGHTGDESWPIPLESEQAAQAVRSWVRTVKDFTLNDPQGRQWAYRLAQGGSLSIKDLAELKTWFELHPTKPLPDEEHKDTPWMDGDHCSYKMRGGHAMHQLASQVFSQVFNQDGVKQGAIVALVPPPHLASMMREFCQDDDDLLHMTLVYLPDYSPANHEMLAHLIREVCKDISPIDLTINGAQVLVTEQGWVHALTPTGLGLSALREALTSNLKRCGLLGVQSYDFVPHVTLTQREAGTLDLDSYQQSLKTSWPTWSVGEVYIVSGDKILGRYPLGLKSDFYTGPDDPKLMESIKSLERRLRALWVEVFNTTLNAFPGQTTKALDAANYAISQAASY